MLADEVGDGAHASSLGSGTDILPSPSGWSVPGAVRRRAAVPVRRRVCRSRVSRPAGEAATEVEQRAPLSRAGRLPRPQRDRADVQPVRRTKEGTDLTPLVARPQVRRIDPRVVALPDREHRLVLLAK